MNILIEQIPGGTAPEEFRTLLAPFLHGGETLTISMLTKDNADNATAVVKLGVDWPQANTIAHKLDGRYWKARHLRSDVPPFMRQ